MTETFHGYIDTTQDVLLVFEGCRRGLLPRVNRRLQDKERKLIQSGTVFVFDEKESGVKRWTDGLVWSPSRILGNFLIYRELEKRNGEKRSMVNNQRQRSYSVDISSTVAAAGGSTTPFDRAKEKRLVGSLSDVYNFKQGGLIKKTMSIVVNGSTQHLISYYNPQDIIENRLRTPSSIPELTSLEISPELLVKQNFRIPPFVEPTLDPIITDSSLTLHRSPPMDNISSLRSMSAGSLNSLRQQSSFIPRFMPDYRPKINTKPRVYSLNYQQPAVYSTMPASTPSPTSLHMSYQQPHPDQSNPHLGHLLNPVHPLNEPEPSTKQPIFYGNRPVSTTSRLI